MKLKLLLLVLALQCGWIGYTVATQELALARGQVILLETQPLDPRDPLRGDYVRLNYKISDVRRNLLIPPVAGEVRAGTAVYVALAPCRTNEFWGITRASLVRFTPANNEVLLHGKSEWSWRNDTQSIHVEYGIERFFVAEGRGNPTGKLTVQAAISKSGRASIKEVLVDGKPYAEVMRK
jgi:uncharacterized membrane-anchored protein